MRKVFLFLVCSVFFCSMITAALAGGDQNQGDKGQGTVSQGEQGSGDVTQQQSGR
ncbi:hypothetical protein ACFL1E_04490 [Candidatus Omnitrophota bacterium]